MVKEYYNLLDVVNQELQRLHAVPTTDQKYEWAFGMIQKYNELILMMMNPPVFVEMDSKVKGIHAW